LFLTDKMRRWSLGFALCRKYAFSSWEDGDGGADWKARDLSERRDAAMDSLFNVGRRQLITDAARDRAKRNVERLRDLTLDPIEVKSCDDSALVESIDELLGDEDVLDTLSFVPSSELRFLKDELYSLSSNDDKSIKSWMKLRSERENTFGSLPKEERNLWSAWYLRDVGDCKTK
jgi:hypothetical protein